MNTTRLQENISALADGELPACDVELTMAALAEPEGQAAWDAYRLIGDVLRADAAAVPMAPGCRERLAHKLAAEPLPGEGLSPEPEAKSAPSGASVEAGIDGATGPAPGDGAGAAPAVAAGASALDVQDVPLGSPAPDGSAPALAR